MALSYALRHKQRCLEKEEQIRLAKENGGRNSQSHVNEVPESGRELSSFSPAEQKKQQHKFTVASTELQNDLKRLGALSDVPEKVALKKGELIPKYTPLVAKYLDAGDVYQNEILVYLIIWLLDAEEYEEALSFADIAIEQGQTMPERFSRDLTTFVAEEIFEWAKKQFDLELSTYPYFSLVVKKMLSEQWVISTPVAASKIYRMAGLIADKEEKHEQAVKFYEACMAANPVGHGVKTRHGEALKKAQTLIDSKEG